jgi:hypothetical protein
MRRILLSLAATGMALAGLTFSPGDASAREPVPVARYQSERRYRDFKVEQRHAHRYSKAQREYWRAHHGHRHHHHHRHHGVWHYHR